MPSFPRPSSAATALAICLLATLSPPSSTPTFAEDAAVLPNTQPLDWQGDLSVRMMDGLHRFVERKIDQSIDKRPQFWHRDFSSPEAYVKSVEANRQRLMKILGVVDPRVRCGWSVLATTAIRPWSPEQIAIVSTRFAGPCSMACAARACFLSPPASRGPAWWPFPTPTRRRNRSSAWRRACRLNRNSPGRLVEAGLQVVVPVLLDRSDEFSGSAEFGLTNQTHREWIHRQAYHMGRHVIGYEVQKVLAAVDWFKEQNEDLKVGVAGYGEGGLLALYAAACDPRIDACLSSGYFQSRQRTWTEPLYRNVWSLLSEFGDAEIATLVAPRGVVIEHSAVPDVPGPPAAQAGHRKCAAAGQISTPNYHAVAGEFHRIDGLLEPGFQVRHLVTVPDNAPTGPLSTAAVEKFLQLMAVSGLPGGYRQCAP